MTLIPRAILAICLLTGRLMYPHYGGPEVRAMTSMHKCGNEMPYLMNVSSLQDPFSLDLGNELSCEKCGTLNFVSGTAMPTAFKFSKLKALNPNQYMNHVTNHHEIYLVHKAFQDNMHCVLAFGKLPTYMQFHFNVFRYHFKPISRDAGITARAGRRIKKPKRIGLSYKQTDYAFRFVPNEAVFIGLQGLLSVMLTSTWTAFETLAGDLWEAALNVRPDRFADLGGTPDRIQSEAEKRGLRAAPNKVTLKRAVNFAKQDGKAYKGKHGTPHRSKLGVRFDSLPKIRAAYSCAFKTPSAAIDNALCDPAIESLMLVRNLLLHRAGVADHLYVKDAWPTPGCPRIRLGKHIRLRGGLVARLIEPVVSASMTLISAVDAEVR